MKICTGGMNLMRHEGAHCGLQGYREILKAGLESGSRIANTPYQRTDWCKVKSDSRLVGFRKAAILPSRTEEDLPSYDEIVPRPTVQEEGSLEAKQSMARHSRDCKLFDVPRPASS
jgi:hypothetical protein